ncbi:MAG: hypothetical protein K5Q68_19790 [Roseococcus sp.]|nr:hypothetical protein [Roseococcus sp.]
MRPLSGLIPLALGLVLQGCANPPAPPPSGMTISLGDAMIQTVEALAATRAHAARQGQRGLRACGAEAVFQVTAMPVTDARGAVAAHLVLAPSESQDGPHSSTVTLTLAGDDCDTPEAPPRRRQQ